MTPFEIGLAIALALAILGGAWLLRERYRLLAERDIAEARLEDQGESRAQLETLAARALRSFEDSPELVVMFIPGDQLVDAALQRQPKLIEFAAELRVHAEITPQFGRLSPPLAALRKPGNQEVAWAFRAMPGSPTARPNRGVIPARTLNLVIAGPSTLIGLLRAVHRGWRERSLSEGAQELFQLGRELHGRAATALGHAAVVGESLRKAQESHNSFVGSLGTRVLPTLRKFEERGARSSKQLTPLPPLDSEARRPQYGAIADVIPTPSSATQEKDPEHDV